MDLRIPVDRYQARYLLERSDNRGQEQSEKPGRPWLVLTGEDLHGSKLFMSCPCSTAKARHDRTYLYENPTFRPSLDRSTTLDLQHLWTFRFDRDCSGQVHDLEIRHIAPVLDRLDARLRPTSGYSEATKTLVGKVVWIDLLATPNIRRSDLAVIRQSLQGVGANWGYEDTKLPAMIVANDLAERSSTCKPLQLITVVPLLDVPELLADSENPKVAIPPYREPYDGANQRYLAVLTQVLLTLDYRSHVVRIKERDGRRFSIPQPQRVFFEHGFLKSWMVRPAERDHVLRDVRRLLDLPPAPVDR